MGTTLHLWKDRIVYTAPTISFEESCRPAIVFFIGVNGDLNLKTLTAEHHGAGFVIGPNVTRTIRAADARHYSLNLDPTHRICRYLRREVLAGREVLDISERISGEAMRMVVDAIMHPQSCADAYRTSQKILNAIFPETVGTQPIDNRIELVAAWIIAHVPASIDLPFLAELCGLSRGRLAHLFTAEIGISLRQYLLWVKMRRAMEMFVLNKPLADVAYEIGFSDSAHLSRTFSRYFGLTPSYLANSRMVRTQLCEAVHL